jgi:pyruvate dehydrogenase E2 component (dihydrolipoamide acetyltransferase)
MEGAAIAVSNAGMHDVTWLTPIINPGQSAILGVGSVRELFRPDAAGSPALRREIGLVFSGDHRVHTGVEGLTFLNSLKALLETPVRLLKRG